ncbi:MAG: helix-turn-helix domain-containing protein [Thermoleophilia bacterium]|nr:helix-turn-helix domain-containing protein [Thermoleophilia bacterium]
MSHVCDRIPRYAECMLSVPEAARVAGKNPETIRRWIRSGRLAASKFGSQHAIDPDDLDEVVHGIRAVGLPDDVSPEHRAFMDRIVRIIREDRDGR